MDEHQAFKQLPHQYFDCKLIRRTILIASLEFICHAEKRIWVQRAHYVQVATLLLLNLLRWRRVMIFTRRAVCVTARTLFLRLQLLGLCLVVNRTIRTNEVVLHVENVGMRWWVLPLQAIPIVGNILEYLELSVFEPCVLVNTLDRHRALVLRVHCLVDHAEGAVCDHFLQFVWVLSRLLLRCFRAVRWWVERGGCCWGAELRQLGVVLFLIQEHLITRLLVWQRVDFDRTQHLGFSFRLRFRGRRQVTSRVYHLIIFTQFQIN